MERVKLKTGFAAVEVLTLLLDGPAAHADLRKMVRFILFIYYVDILPRPFTEPKFFICDKHQLKPISPIHFV